MTTRLKLQSGVAVAVACISGAVTSQASANLSGPTPSPQRMWKEFNRCTPEEDLKHDCAGKCKKVPLTYLHRWSNGDVSCFIWEPDPSDKDANS